MQQQRLEGSFWGRVGELLRARHMKLTALAEQSGVEYRRIIMQRHRSALPTVVDTLAIARVLGVSVEYLVDGAHPVTDRRATRFRKYADIEADLATMEKACPDRIELVRHLIDITLGRPEVENKEAGKVIKFPAGGNRSIGND